MDFSIFTTLNSVPTYDVCCRFSEPMVCTFSFSIYPGPNAATQVAVQAAASGEPQVLSAEPQHPAQVIASTEPDD